ncbi:class I SAM-dependent methyltransferase [Paenibacillus eucommiae]|uniref:class I SAM-dependent methyltransferase n=1 Tax=Paenibacillus eucommiae TaxID=1355755 RepID=UPI001AE6F29D|nr:phospholipid methyltransferase [Paenibacillus eucommiae]
MLNIKSLISEKFLFLSRFFHTPGQIGSVTPSSRFLARKMVESVPWNQVYHIAELGAGTGAITKYIQTAKRRNTKVLLFEKDPILRNKLANEYANPDLACYEDCRELYAALCHENIEHLDCIISGLPFFNFPQVIRDQLIEQIIISLKPDGLFIAFQYSQQMRNQLSEHFIIEKIKFVPMNLPPAFVYVCRKKAVPV